MEVRLRDPIYYFCEHLTDYVSKVWRGVEGDLLVAYEIMITTKRMVDEGKIVRFKSDSTQLKKKARRRTKSKGAMASDRRIYRADVTLVRLD